MGAVGSALAGGGFFFVMFELGSFWDGPGVGLFGRQSSPVFLPVWLAGAAAWVVGRDGLVETVGRTWSSSGAKGGYLQGGPYDDGSGLAEKAAQVAMVPAGGFFQLAIQASCTTSSASARSTTGGGERARVHAPFTPPAGRQG